MRIEQEYKKNGYFWLPGQESKKIPGVLSIMDGGDIELEVIDLTNEDSSWDKANLSRIIGIVEKDGFVTLNDCFYTNRRESYNIIKLKICVNMALIGASWLESDKITCKTFTFSLDCLNEWLGTRGIRADNNYDTKTSTMTYSFPEEIKFLLDNEMSLSIGYQFVSSYSPTMASMKQQAYFKLESETLSCLDEFINVVFKLTHFMCFVVSDVVSIKDVVITTPKFQEELGENKQYSVPISIYYRSTTFTEKISKKHNLAMLLTFNVIKNNIKDVFNNWLNSYEDLSPAMNLYFSTKLNAQKYIDGKFLALAQGLETYHRRTSNEVLMEPNIFSKLVDDILLGCPEEHKEWLQGRLMYGNEISLNKRLKSIIEPFKEYFGNSKQRSKLLKDIVTTRNYLTHYSKELETESVKDIDLWSLCQKMEAIFNLHFLKIIGLTDEKIKLVVENNYALRQALKFNTTKKIQ